MAEPQMTVYQRAAQLWPILVMAARNQQILSFHLISRLTGLPARMGNFLEPVAAYCRSRSFPDITVLVVNEEDGVPGERYAGPPTYFEEQARAFVFNWLEKVHPAPYAR